MSKKTIHFSKDKLILEFSPDSGSLLHLSSLDGSSRLGHGDFEHALDARIGWGEWLTQDHNPTLHQHRQIPDGISLEIKLGPLLLHDEYKVNGERIERSVKVVNQSDKEVQLTGLRMQLVGARIGRIEDSVFEAPATIVRPRLPFSVAVQQDFGVTPDVAFAPGSLGWMQMVRGAPDITPGLLAIHNPDQLESLMIWYYSEIESGAPQVSGDGSSLCLGHEIGLAGWMAPGAELQGGIQTIQFVKGSWEDSLDVYRQTYQRSGIDPPLYGEAPNWVPAASIYEVHPGMYGGFNGLREALPQIHSMGFDVLYLMPVMKYDNRSREAWDSNWLGSGSPYAMKDFEEFDPTLGTKADFVSLVDEAHHLGMRVLMDFVAQGCALDARYVSEHPEWFCRDEQGNLVSSHGWVDTYSLDWANPEYQDFMLDWALRFINELGIDGFRVDAPHGKEPNWDRDITYHASFTNLGATSMLERLQKGIKQIKPEAVLLCELFGPLFVKSHDFQYDYHLHALLYALIEGRVSPYEFGEWLRDYWSVMPPSAIRVGFTETHDTRAGFPAYAWRGSAVERAMFAILVMAGFVPMLWSGQEVGWETFYRKVLKGRSQSTSLLQGEREFNAVSCENPHVLSILCRRQGETVWGVVSLYAERTPLTFDVSRALDVKSQSRFRLHDLIEEQDWNEYGREEWAEGDSQSLTLSLVPFVPYFFQIST
jgi:starch synthase (maltosyl-transferring)